MLIDKKLTEATPLLSQAGYLVDNWQGSQYQKEYLKVFFLVLQVLYLLTIFKISCLYIIFFFKFLPYMIFMFLNSLK